VTDSTVDATLSDCGCCEGVSEVTPEATDNPRGASALHYRAGTAASFRESMLAGISRQPALSAMRVRRADDPTIALTDAWACVLDVLTFYNERIANEAYLRTATEGLSLVQLARTVGYERAPGRAAAATLAFTLEEGVGAPAEVPIPTGTKVASVPGPGELPQTFETVEDVTARPEWNAIAAADQGSPDAELPLGRLYVDGSATTIRVGETLLFRLESGGFLLHQVERVTPLPSGVTEVFWGEPVTAAVAEVHVLHQRAAVFGAAAPDWRSLPDSIRGHYDVFFAE
jgi:hypothetical protein